ncbi:MAG: hypothetical protein IKK30_00380 [Clostridia bacterium]|nr:hypothetical protein [Clostridia bacterium]
MITTRTRILSILATVAMLVSMLACFVIPASADESITAPYAALLEDVPGATNLAAVISTATDETTLSDALAQDVAAGNITWPTWEYGNVDYPRYAYKAVYVAAGYTDLVYSITAPEDWTAMVTASNAATPETFAGYTFHVTNDVDFDATPNDDESNEGIVMYPLNAGTAGKYNTYENPFQGTIDGHGNAFKNINVKDNLTTMTANRIVGMISRLGDGAVVKNFGVDSGKITMDTASVARASAATFGQGLPSDTEATKPQLINVWSGVDITVSTGSTSSWASGILGYSADTKGGPIVNGAYFFGTLTASGSGSKGTHGILYNLRTGHVYNSLSNPGTATYAITLQSNATSSMFKNIYSVGYDPVDVGSSAVTATNVTDNKCGNASSVEIGAWEINKANAVAAAADGVDKVFFTITEDGIRPTGDETNRIIKITVNNVDHYINKNTELSQEYVLGLANLEQFTTVTVDGDAASFPLTAADEMEITVAADAGAAVEAAWEAYRELSTTYLSAEAAAAWLEASAAVSDVANAEEGTDTTELVDTANGKITALETALADYGTYSTYPAEDGKAIPGYKDVELYGDYNTAHVWTINEPEDWTAMVDASDIALGDDVETFENHIFHVTDNIDFDDPDAEGTVGIKMAPLSLGNGTNNNATGAFKGTIEGHGKAFENINIYDDLELGVNRISGLIGKLGAGAVINDFGVASGTIELTGDNGETAIAVATFGEGAIASGDTVPQLNKVWSNATIKLTATTEHAQKNVAGIIANEGDTYGGVTINGVYFSGKLEGGAAQYGILYNLRTSHVYNALGNPQTATYALQLNSKATASLFKNIYSVGTDPVNVGSSSVELTATHGGNAASALAGAWAINNAQTTEDEIADVYFTKDGENIRFGNVDNRIVKVSVNNDEKAIYVNNGTTLNKADFADLYEVGENAIIINEDASVAEVTANGDTTVAITIDYDAFLESIRAEYRKLDAMYLTDTAAGLLDTFLNSTEDAQTVLATEGALITALTGGVYTTYPATDAGKAVPGYKDVELYGAYNTAKVWTINEPADWLKMVDDSVANDFYGYVFHVTDNIDFSTVTEPMLPLNYGENALKDQAYYPFNGTIEGHGHAFKDINVRVTVNNSGKDCMTGMIGKLGQFAVINNFGVDSGDIYVDGNPSLLHVSTFGEPMNKAGDGSALTAADPKLQDQHAVLNQVWSGANITAASTGTNYALGIVCHPQNTYMEIHGAYFFGTLDATNKYAISAQARHTLYNALADVEGSPAMFVAHAGGTVNNVYNVGAVPFAPLDGVTITNNGNVSSALEGAWTINSKQSAEDANAVYFTLKENGDIRFGEEANRIVKVTVNDEPEYVNVGTTLDKAYFVDMLGVSEAAITSITVGEEDYTDTSVAAADGLAVTVVLDEVGALQAQLADKVAEYDGLDDSYFKTTAEIDEDGKIGLAEFLTLAASNEVADLNKAIDAINEGGDWTLVDEITEDYTKVPAYKLHATYDAYNAGKNWLIATPEDWYAMDTYANAQAAGDYFAGVTFHLKEDVNFNHVWNSESDAANEDQVNYMWPLGNKGDATQVATLRSFAGTIDGHGHGFENVYVIVFKANHETNAKADFIPNYAGLFAYLGDCEIRNFGINSGTIETRTANARGAVSSFGAIQAGKTVTFNKVWSGATLIGVSGSPISALAAIYERNNDCKVAVDGFVFTGKMKKDMEGRDIAYGVFGANGYTPDAASTYANILSYPTVQEGIYTYMFGGTAEGFSAASTSNIFGYNKGDNNDAGVGIRYDYRSTTTGVSYSSGTYGGVDGVVATPPAYLTEMSIKAAAWTINNGNTGAEGDVYFKLVDGNVRPTGTETDKIVKVVATVGEEPKTGYINVNQAYTNTELRDALGYGVDTTITNVDVTSGGEYAEGVLTVTGDAEITVTIDVCEHTDVEYAHNGKNSHTATCKGCGYVFEAEACEKNWVAGEVNADGTSTHKAVCPDCEHEYVEECNGTLSQTNCLEDGTWEFECEFHTGTYPATGTAKESHNWGGWTQVDGVENKFCRECTDCDVKEYKLLGVASATGVELYCKENGTITITLPENLASADLTFAIEGEGYTITEVAGATKDGDVYKVSGSTSVTVTIAADVTAVGGTFNVAVANAKDAEDTAIEFAGATATIGFTSIEGDANGDKTVNLADALAALYKVAQKPGAADINVKNADIDGTEGFTINDVYAIVREWLITTLGE